VIATQIQKRNQYRSTIFGAREKRSADVRNRQRGKKKHNGVEDRERDLTFGVRKKRKETKIREPSAADLDVRGEGHPVKREKKGRATRSLNSSPFVDITQQSLMKKRKEGIEKPLL